MAINLAAKYSDKIAGMYTVGSLVADKTSNEWDFSGVKTIKAAKERQESKALLKNFAYIP